MSQKERVRRLEQIGGGRGPVQFWVATGDGFVRHWDEVLPEDEFMTLYPRQHVFTLQLGDSELEE